MSKRLILAMSVSTGHGRFLPLFLEVLGRISPASASKVHPRRGTPIGTHINQIMKPYLRAYKQAIATNSDPNNSGVKPVNMIVITDGVPTDDPESVIVSIAQRLDKADAPPYQVSFQFFQVGNKRGTAEALPS
ncbi:hypothetical protein B0T25DRAFT_520307 [Lasiosphaeria hispida]|uniref:VWFA domain-containing protein n=1 Tax=Lasiosphaeria hispida TaxID=260671 RepID=A0AAJ0HGS4_9PEZI|nr:hypothetical protein B0T25DRAFT_520307 [Lasiosphaeria hispida]